MDDAAVRRDHTEQEARQQGRYHGVDDEADILPVAHHGMLDLVDTGIIDQDVDAFVGGADVTAEPGHFNQIGQIRLPGLDGASAGQGAQLRRGGCELFGIAAMDQQWVPLDAQAQGQRVTNAIGRAGNEDRLGHEVSCRGMPRRKGGRDGCGDRVGRVQCRRPGKGGNKALGPTPQILYGRAGAR